ncbi:MAG: DUF354 domain-containing protein [Verrucomicrobiota bacterium]
MTHQHSSAGVAKSNKPSDAETSLNDHRPPAFWLDLENITCVTFFEPIVRELIRRGHRVDITYRECPHIAGLLDIYRLEGRQIGRSGGRHVLRKVQKGLSRALLLAWWARKRQFDIAIGFGARPLAIACRLLGIPNATVIDYEHVSLTALRKCCDWIFVPADVQDAFWKAKQVPDNKLVKFQGLKEQVYVPHHPVNPELRSRLEVSSEHTFVLIRPPAHMAHYHDKRSEAVLQRVLDRVAADRTATAIVIPRTAGPPARDTARAPNIRGLDAPVNGLDLIAAADLVISGGGTMIREAAALGVPAYSIFTGPIGAIDARLSEERKLVLVRHPEEVDQIKFERRLRSRGTARTCSSNLDFFLDRFIRLADSSHAAARYDGVSRKQSSL